MEKYIHCPRGFYGGTWGGVLVLVVMGMILVMVMVKVVVMVVVKVAVMVVMVG